MWPFDIRRKRRQAEEQKRLEERRAFEEKVEEDKRIATRKSFHMGNTPPRVLTSPQFNPKPRVSAEPDYITGTFLVDLNKPNVAHAINDPDDTYQPEHETNHHDHQQHHSDHMPSDSHSRHDGTTDLPHQSYSHDSSSDSHVDSSSHSDSSGDSGGD